MTKSIAGTTLAQRLRAETAQAHRLLEAGLGFDIHNPDADIAIGMLQSFYRVLQVFEPAMLALVPDRLRDRSRLAVLKDNLWALGRDPHALSPASDIWLPLARAEAMGALYVLEGSTLGGKVIAKALRRLPEWPLGKKNYFDPYHSETGAMWSAFLLELDGIEPQDCDAVVFGANRTFSMLESVMAQEVTA